MRSVRFYSVTDNFVDGLRQGTKIVYDDGMEQFIIYNYHNDMLHGVCSIFDKSYKIMIKSAYVEGRHHGLHVEYYSNGIVSNICFYDRDILCGYNTQYDTNGSKIYQTKYVNGSNTGPSVCWYGNGMLFKVYSCYQGRKNGVEFIWDRRGKVSACIKWYKGEIIRELAINAHTRKADEYYAKYDTSERASKKSRYVSTI